MITERCLEPGVSAWSVGVVDAERRFTAEFLDEWGRSSRPPRRLTVVWNCDPIVGCVTVVGRWQPGALRIDRCVPSEQPVRWDGGQTPTAALQQWPAGLGEAVAQLPGLVNSRLEARATGQVLVLQVEDAELVRERASSLHPSVELSQARFSLAELRRAEDLLEPLWSAGPSDGGGLVDDPSGVARKWISTQVVE